MPKHNTWQNYKLQLQNVFKTETQRENLYKSLGKFTFLVLYIYIHTTLPIQLQYDSNTIYLQRLLLVSVHAIEKMQGL